MAGAIDCAWRSAHNQNKSQREFVESVSKQFEQRGWISPKQIAILRNITDRATRAAQKESKIA